MLDNTNDPLDPVADPPDNQGGGTTSTLASDSTSKTQDPPDNQGGGTTTAT